MFKSFVRWPQFRLLFATMANPSEDVLTILFKEGVGACVNSRRHLDLCLSLGCTADRIQFTTTGITRPDMRFLIANSIPCNADSEQQAKNWFSLNGRRVGLRINAATLNPTELRRDRIGIDSKHVPDILKTLETYDGVINGLHVYLGTNILDCGLMLRTLAPFFELASTIPTLEYLNIGGGIGVDYLHRGSLFDLGSFGRGLDGMLERLGRNIFLYFEPGRSLIANAGCFVVSVTDVKTLSGKRYVCVDGSVAQFPRPLHHPDTPHNVRHLWSERASPLRDATVVGRTTFSRDVLADGAQLPAEIKIGDLLVFDDAGAYCSSMASRFLGQPDTVGVVI